MWLLDEYRAYAVVRNWKRTEISWTQTRSSIRDVAGKCFEIGVVIVLLVEAGTLLMKWSHIDEPSALARSNIQTFKQRATGTPALEYVFRELYVAPVMRWFDTMLEAWLRGEERPTEIVSSVQERERVAVVSWATWDQAHDWRRPPDEDGSTLGELRKSVGMWLSSRHRVWNIALSVWFVFFLALVVAEETKGK